jgi:hypothetical protein
VQDAWWLIAASKAANWKIGHDLPAVKKSGEIICAKIRYNRPRQKLSVLS